MLEFSDALLKAIRGVEDGLDSLGQVVNAVLPSEQQTVKVALAQSHSEEATQVEQPTTKVDRDWDATLTSLVKDHGQGRAKERSSLVRQSFSDLMTQGGFEDSSATPRENHEGPGGPVIVNTQSFRRYAFGGGDLGSIGVTPAEISGFHETRRRRSGLAPNQRMRADGSVETHYVAANALQAIMKLVDESVARQLGSMGVR